MRSVAGIDQSNGKLLVVGTGREPGRDPYLRHLYAVPSKGGAMKLLTPEPLDHDGINDAFLEKASAIHYLHRGKWTLLRGMD